MIGLGKQKDIYRTYIIKLFSTIHTDSIEEFKERFAPGNADSRFRERKKMKYLSNANKSFRTKNTIDFYTNNICRQSIFQR